MFPNYKKAQNEKTIGELIKGHFERGYEMISQHITDNTSRDKSQKQAPNLNGDGEYR
jgi:hypothetical protein